MLFQNPVKLFQHLEETEILEQGVRTWAIDFSSIFFAINFNIGISCLLAR